MQFPSEVYIPENAREQIRAIIPFAYDYALSVYGGWTIYFLINEDQVAWELDEEFLKENKLTLKSEVERDYVKEEIEAFGRPFIRNQSKRIKLTLTYKP